MIQDAIALVKGFSYDIAASQWTPVLRLVQVVKRCIFCGKFFVPDPRAENRQKACPNGDCRKARKRLAHKEWCRKNPTYYREHYVYVKEWRKRQIEEAVNPNRPDAGATNDRPKPARRSSKPLEPAQGVQRAAAKRRKNRERPRNHKPVHNKKGGRDDNGR